MRPLTPEEALIALINSYVTVPNPEMPPEPERHFDVVAELRKHGYEIVYARPSTQVDQGVDEPCR